MKNYKFRIKLVTSNLGGVKYFPQVKRFLFWEYISYYASLKEVYVNLFQPFYGKDSLSKADESIEAFKKRKHIKTDYIIFK